MKVKTLALSVELVLTSVNGSLLLDSSLIDQVAVSTPFEKGHVADIEKTPLNKSHS